MPGWAFERSMESSRKLSTGSMDEANQLCDYSEVADMPSLRS